MFVAIYFLIMVAAFIMYRKVDRFQQNDRTWADVIVAFALALFWFFTIFLYLLLFLGEHLDKKYLSNKKPPKWL
jgi:hypothetical protein